MPELPEVECTRRSLAKVLEGRQVCRVDVVRIPRFFRDAQPLEWERCLLGARVDAVVRRGKYLWWVLDRRPWPLFHLGMTGAFVVAGTPPIRLRSVHSRRRPDSVWPPPHVVASFRIEGGREFALTSVRRLGGVWAMREGPEHRRLAKLGFDPLDGMPSIEAFTQKLQARRGAIKGVLLDQSFAAGVGNWIADEVLYQAGVAPRRAATSLDATEIARVRAALITIVRVAVDVEADADRFPREWIFHRRWERGRREGATKGDAPRRAVGPESPIRFDTIAGRTTAWDPTRQR